VLEIYFSIVLALFSLFAFLGSCIRSMLSSFSMFGFLGSQIISKFIGVLLLLVVLSVIMVAAIESCIPK
jgi:hypothetical protein